MKHIAKVFFYSVLFCSLSFFVLFVPSPVHAQSRWDCFWNPNQEGCVAPKNSFRCIWDEEIGRCVTNMKSANCKEGFVPSDSCLMWKNKSACMDGAITYQCVGANDRKAEGNLLEDIYLPELECTEGVYNSAIGCIPYNDPQETLSFILKWIIGISSGISFMLILISGFKILISSGNPEQIKDGQEQLTATISGLILIIFSVFILKFIGIELFKIPGFSK